MTFKTDHFTHYEDPELNLYALHDSVGTPFLLLAGMEPDLRWERFITAVRLLAERLGVRRVIGMGTIPMAVPHTRPITLTAHANDKELIADHTPWVGEVQVPGSVSNLLEFRMSQHGHEVVGFTVHVPHYFGPDRRSGSGAYVGSSGGSIRWIIQFLPSVPEQDVLPAHPLAVERDHDLLVTPLVDLERAAVEDLHRPGAVVALRDLAVEVQVFERVVLGLDRQVVALRGRRGCPSGSPS